MDVSKFYQINLVGKAEEVWDMSVTCSKHVPDFLSHVSQPGLILWSDPICAVIADEDYKPTSTGLLIKSEHLLFPNSVASIILKTCFWPKRQKLVGDLIDLAGLQQVTDFYATKFSVAPSQNLVGDLALSRFWARQKNGIWTLPTSLSSIPGRLNNLCRDY